MFYFEIQSCTIYFDIFKLINDVIDLDKSIILSELFKNKFREKF